jgi:hypothetical protein
LASENVVEFGATLPTKPLDTFDLPKVREVVSAVGKSAVSAFVEIELVKLADRLSVSGNMSDGQIVFLSSTLIETFPNETLADFKICFERGAVGRYGNIFRMDGIVLMEWMKKYLDEKYQELEDQLMKEKDHPYIPTGPEKIGFAPIKNGMPAPPEVAQKYIDEMAAQFKPQKEHGFTEDDIKELGQEKPVRRGASYVPQPSTWEPKTWERSMRQWIKDEYGNIPESKVLEILEELKSTLKP